MWLPRCSVLVLAAALSSSQPIYNPFVRVTELEKEENQDTAWDLATVTERLMTVLRGQQKTMDTFKKAQETGAWPSLRYGCYLALSPEIVHAVSAVDATLSRGGSLVGGSVYKFAATQDGEDKSALLLYCDGTTEMANTDQLDLLFTWMNRWPEEKNQAYWN